MTTLRHEAASVCGWPKLKTAILSENNIPLFISSIWLHAYKNR